MKHHRRWGIRGKLTALTVALTVIPALIGSLTILVLLQQALLGNLSSRVTQRAFQVANVVQTRGVNEDALDHEYQVDHSLRIQVIDVRDRVRYRSSPNDVEPLSPARPMPGEPEVSGVSPVPTVGDDLPLVVSAVGVTREGTNYTVLVAANQLAQHEAVVTTARVLLAVFPLLLLLGAGTTWWLVGRTLQPVERMRETVETISSRNLDERVAESNATDEIGRLAHTLNSMLDRLDHGQRVQREFVADASHELRSPLAGLRASLQLGERTDSLEEWRALSPLMTVEAGRLDRLVEDLLTLSKLDEGRRRPDRVDVDLDDVVACEAARVRALGSVQVSMRIAPARISADESEISRVVRNLTDNAVRAANSAVRFTLTTDGGLARLSIDDDGEGIPEEDRERVFSRFVRLAPDRARESGGSGLGLAIVRELVTTYGGAVIATSSDLGGASFVVTLPMSTLAEPVADPT